MANPTTVTISYWHGEATPHIIVSSITEGGTLPAIKQNGLNGIDLYSTFRESNPGSIASIRIQFDSIPDVAWITKFFSYLSLFDEFDSDSFPKGQELANPYDEYSFYVNLCTTQSDVQILLDAALAQA